MTIIGIDPGVTGAFCVMYEGNPVALIDTPVDIGYAAKKTPSGNLKIRRHLNARNIAEVLRHELHGSNPEKVIVMAYIEKAQPMPDQGVSTVFNYGVGYGVWLGVLGAMKIDVVEVRPADWKYQFFDKETSKDKSASIDVACRAFPGWADSMKRKKDHNRAEALLIATWGWQAQRGQLKPLARRTHG
jgi:crossover junction endodeoxyribonuclease RuvC